MSDPVAIAILAAGAGSRMRGGDKTLEDVNGVPLLRRLACRALETRHPVVVTLPPHAPARADALDGLNLSLVVVPDADTGMSASFRALAGISTDLLICLGDMPEITSDHMAACIDARDGARPVRAVTPQGTPGQPVLFPKGMVPLFKTLTGDQGAQPLLRGLDVIPVALPGRSAVTDLDTPEAWSAWRAARGGTRRE